MKEEAGHLGVADAETCSTSHKSSDVVTPEQEYFLYELETSDSGSIGLVLRAIYDGGDPHKFIRALEKKIRLYDKDIEKLCNYHYGGFVDAVQELLNLKLQCDQIRQNIVEVDGYLKENSKCLMQKAGQIVKLRKTQKNVAAAIDSVSLCLPVLEKYAKLQEQIELKKYYPALKIVEQLEHTYLPRVERYRFAKKIADNIQIYRGLIKEASFSDFTDFLENIRNVTAKIGQVALKHANELYNARGAAALPFRRRSAQLDVLLSTVVAADSTDQEKNVASTARSTRLNSVEEEEFSAQDMIDFSPVYKCCLIFGVLNDKDSFESYYRKQRREQASVLLKAPERISSNNLEVFTNYFHEVVGFFVVEDHIMNTASGLVTRAYRDELWEIAASHVEKTLNNHFGQCTDAYVMLEIKNLIILFANTMKSYGFQIGTLYKILQNFREQYNEILMSKHCAKFDEVLLEDGYCPLVVENDKEMNDLFERFPLARKVTPQRDDYTYSDEKATGVDQIDYVHQSANDNQSAIFPVQFPFSEFVPKVFEEVKDYILGCIKFMDNLKMSQNDVEETVRRGTNLLFERFSGHLKQYLIEEMKSSSLVQLIQITINMGYLEKSCEPLEHFISSLNGSSGTSGHVSKLKRDMFRDARSEAEERIDEAMRQKIEEILSVAQYTWDLPASSGRASGYITDLIAFLRTTFVSFTNLPPILARHICMQACKYLSNSMTAFLMDVDVKQVSPGALEQFNLDVIQCELFTAQCPVPGFEDSTLAMTFADLRQLMDLTMLADWTTYLADFGQEHSKYDRVHPNSAACLLEKIMEYDRRRSAVATTTLFSKQPKDSKDKRKLHETVLRQLKILVTSGTPVVQN